MPSSRQLAAIMFTDIVGYTALMGKDEQKAFELLRKNREIHKPLIKQFHGTWIKELGDGVLASFHTATDGVFCAAAIQEASNLVDGLQLRIGIHLGEVIFENNDVFGDGVNIASRLQAMASPGSIWVSEAVHKNLANKREINSEFVKDAELKNVSEPVKVYEIFVKEIPGYLPPKTKSHQKLEPNHKKTVSKTISVTAILIVAGLAVLYFSNSNRKADQAALDKPTTERTIAVLPFKLIGRDEEGRYFADGVADVLINQLSGIEDLRVKSRTSVEQYQDTRKTIPEIARELNVDYVIEGSAQKYKNDIRIIVQLINPKTDDQIWKNDYTKKFEDVLNVQSEIALQVVEELNITLAQGQKQRIKTKPTENTEAYDLFLKGHYALNNSTLEGYRNAENFFQEAIKKDPNFRLARSYLANTYIGLTVVMGDLPPSTGARKAMDVLNSILQKDTLYIDFNTLASIEILVNKNFSKGEYYLKKAINLNTSDEASYIFYALLLTLLGRTEEAFVQLDKSKTKNPVSSFEFATRGETYYASGRYDDAIKTFREAIQVFPQVNILYDDLGRVYVAQGKYQEAMDVLSTGVTPTTRPPSTLAFMAIANFKLNNAKKSNELIQELKQRAIRGEKGINIFLAIYFSAIDNKEESFKYLDQALNTNDVDLIWLHKEPSFNNLRNDERFNTYLKRAGF